MYAAAYFSIIRLVAGRIYGILERIECEIKKIRTFSNFIEISKILLSGKTRGAYIFKENIAFHAQRTNVLNESLIYSLQSL